MLKPLKSRIWHFPVSPVNSPARCPARAWSWRLQWACAAGTRSGTRAHRSALRAWTPYWCSPISPRKVRRLGYSHTPSAPCSASGRSPAWCFGGRGANRSRSEPWRYRPSLGRQPPLDRVIRCGTPSVRFRAGGGARPVPSRSRTEPENCRCLGPSAHTALWLV